MLLLLAPFNSHFTKLSRRVQRQQIWRSRSPFLLQFFLRGADLIWWSFHFPIDPRSSRSNSEGASSAIHFILDHFLCPITSNLLVKTQVILAFTTMFIGETSCCSEISLKKYCELIVLLAITPETHRCHVPPMRGKPAHLLTVQYNAAHKHLYKYIDIQKRAGHIFHAHLESLLLILAMLVVSTFLTALQIKSPKNGQRPIGS